MLSSEYGTRACLCIRAFVIIPMCGIFERFAPMAGVTFRFVSLPPTRLDLSSPGWLA